LPALHAARDMAVRESRGLIVVSVVEPPAIIAFTPQPVMQMPSTIQEQLDVRRQSVHDRLAQLGPAPFGYEEPEITVQYGEPARVIGTIAREQRAHLIVMGIGPHAITNRVLATETTLATIRRAPCPVLAVADHGIVPPRIVVVALDFGPASLHAARQALTLLSDGAVVHLIHAWHPNIPIIPVEGEDPLDQAYERALPARFDRARTLLGRERSLVFVASARKGDASAVLLEAARGLHADLIVAGTHGRSFVQRLLVGSACSALVRGTSCSVFVAPPPPAAERARIERHMTGTSTVRAPEEWAEELDAFAHRNHSRPTTLEIDDISVGAQVQERGYALVGATYDHRDRHVSLMFADPENPDAHLTRTLAGVRSVSVSHGPGNEDGVLCIESDQGSTLLTFLDRPGG
jgi:nucleotide-binding universal stress UspA family protein